MPSPLGFCSSFLAPSPSPPPRLVWETPELENQANPKWRPRSSMEREKLHMPQGPDQPGAPDPHPGLKAGVLVETGAAGAGACNEWPAPAACRLSPPQGLLAGGAAVASVWGWHCLGSRHRGARFGPELAQLSCAGAPPPPLSQVPLWVTLTWTSSCVSAPQPWPSGRKSGSRPPARLSLAMAREDVEQDVWAPLRSRGAGLGRTCRPYSGLSGGLTPPRCHQSP